MSQYILSPEAGDDVEEIFDYIVAMERLAEMPGMGHLHRQPLQVVRVLHGARDVKSILARGF